MKTLLLITLAVSISLSNTNAQTLEENKVDEFTKNAVKRTSWEPLIQSGKWYLFFRVSKINDAEYLDMKMMYYKNNKYQVIDEGMKIMLMLQNDSVINLSNIKYAISCRGCGARGFSGSSALGIQVNYRLPAGDHDQLKLQPVKKIRVYTTEGYIEDDVKDKRTNLFIDLVKLIE